MASLRRPSPYPGLGEYFETNPPPRPLTPLLNRPLSVFQMQTSDPIRKLEENSLSQHTGQGTVFPELDHFNVDADVCTLYPVGKAPSDLRLPEIDVDYYAVQNSRFWNGALRPYGILTGLRQLIGYHILSHGKHIRVHTGYFT